MVVNSPKDILATISTQYAILDPATSGELSFINRASVTRFLREAHNRLFSCDIQIDAAKSAQTTNVITNFQWKLGHI
jgi:hypothetical protein